MQIRPFQSDRDGSLSRPDQLTCHRYLTCRRVSRPGTPAGQYYSGPFTGSFCQSGEPDIFPWKLVSTHQENIDIIRYFWKRGNLIRIKPVKIAGFYESVFLEGIIPRRNERRACFGSPGMAIRIIAERRKRSLRRSGM